LLLSTVCQHHGHDNYHHHCSVNTSLTNAPIDNPTTGGDLLRCCLSSVNWVRKLKWLCIAGCGLRRWSLNYVGWWTDRPTKFSIWTFVTNNRRLERKNLSLPCAYRLQLLIQRRIKCACCWSVAKRTLNTNIWSSSPGASALSVGQRLLEKNTIDRRIRPAKHLKALT